jgi:hypothetical protein
MLKVKAVSTKPVKPAPKLVQYAKVTRTGRVYVASGPAGSRPKTGWKPARLVPPPHVIDLSLF